MLALNLAPGPPGAAKYEPAGALVATGWDMKALLVLALTALAAVSALALGHTDVATGVMEVVSQSSWPTEPAALLVSGSVLIGLAGAIRRSI